MRKNAIRDGRWRADQDARWRRRFFILGGAIAVLALLAWLFTATRPDPAATLPGSATLAPDAAAPDATVPGLDAQDPAAIASGTGAGATRCLPGDIVLSLFPSRPGYRRGARPRFDVYAVSSAVAACQLAFGPGTVRVIVTRRGRVVWDSAACGRAPAATVWFQPGVPRLLIIAWNRAAKRPAGCAGSLSPAAWGTFDAFAVSAGQSSAVSSFKLLR